MTRLLSLKRSILLLRSAIVGPTLLLVATVAMAQDAPSERRTAVGVHIGVDPIVAATVVRGAETSGLFGTARVHNLSFSEVYRQAWMFGGEVSYAFAESREALVRLTYTRATSRGPVEFRESITRFPMTRIAGFAEFTDYSAVAIEGGVRWHFGSAGMTRPYVGGMGGVAIVRTITIDPPVRMTPLRGPGQASNVFFKRSAVPTIGAISGLSFVVRPDLYLRIEAGLRYQARPEPEPPDEWTGPWLNEIYDGFRWSVPVTGTVQFRF